MNIASIEVIRRKSLVGVRVAPGERVELTYGDTLRVNVGFDYRGLAMKTTLEGAIGKLHAFPTEWLEVLLKNGVEIDLPESTDFIPCERSVEIPITSDIDPGTDYDLSVSLLDYREAGHPTIVDVIDIVGIPPTYEKIQHTIYPWAYVFEGNAETCIFEFQLTPEQIPGTEWLGQRIVDSFVTELEKEGSRLLELKVYRDTTPTWWTNYRVEVTATASPLAWNLIIIGVLAILFIVAIVFALKAVESLVYHRKGLDEETKKTFSRDTLTAMILDLAPETPPETLEAMEDQELRDLLNRLIAEEAPPISWWPFAILGGVGLLGVGGAAVAYAMAKPKE
ncbi:hypothetical protein ES707_01970 [subsurface metagenome]